MSTGQTTAAADEDRALARRIAAGDQAAFGDLHAQYNSSLLAFLKSRVSANDADDVANRVWMTLYRKPPVNDGQHVRGWLFKVARHAVIDHWRKQGNSPELFAEGAADEISSPVPATPDDDQRQTDLQDCLRDLEEDFERPLRMWMLGAKHDEIAEKLSIPEATSHTRVGRGKTKVKDCMQRKGWTR